MSKTDNKIYIPRGLEFLYCILDFDVVGENVIDRLDLPPLFLKPSIESIEYDPKREQWFAKIQREGE